MDAFDMELQNRGEESEDIREQQEVQDTNVDDFDFDDLTRRYNNLLDPEHTTTRPATDVLPDVPVGREERIDLNKEIVLRKLMGEYISRGDGEVSRRLIDNLELVEGKDGKINGLNYKGKRVVISDRRGGYTFSSSKEFAEVKDEFLDQLDDAITERADKDIRQNVSEILADGINQQTEDVELDILNLPENQGFTIQENREIRGDLKEQGPIIDAQHAKAQQDAYKAEIEDNEQQAEKETDPEKKSVLKKVTDVLRMKLDKIRVENKQEPLTEKIQDLLENNDVSKLEKFKKWARENLVGLSTIAITIAGIVTTVVVATRSVIRKGAAATSKFAKAVAKAIKAISPILAPLGTLIGKLISLGAKGVSFIANNLWLLVLFVVYLFHDTIRQKIKFR